jgi:hypothetical protein
VRKAIACVKPTSCIGSGWDEAACVCSTKVASSESAAAAGTSAVIALRVVRGGQEMSLSVRDPAPEQRAGDVRALKARPVIPMSPYALGVVAFLISLTVIGTHGLLSGTATMDFGGRKAAATAGGMIDGFVYLGTGLQSLGLGYLTERSFTYWPPFLLPFAVIGFLLCLRIWNAKPKARSAPTEDAADASEPAEAA